MVVVSGDGCDYDDGGRYCSCSSNATVFIVVVVDDDGDGVVFVDLAVADVVMVSVVGNFLSVLDDDFVMV